MSRKLSDRQSRFVEEYLCDLNATQAAIRAGYSERTAGVIGFENLKKPEIAEAIVKAMGKREERTEITQDAVLKLWWEQANVDVNEIVQFRRGSCDECWEDEPQDAPNPGCRICKGDGVGNAFIHDSRNLKGAARRLFNGVQMTKDGFKVLLLDRDKALENVARHLGMFNDKLSIGGQPDNPVQHKHTVAPELTPEQWMQTFGPKA